MKNVWTALLLLMFAISCQVPDSQDGTRYSTESFNKALDIVNETKSALLGDREWLTPQLVQDLKKNQVLISDVPSVQLSKTIEHASTAIQIDETTYLVKLSLLNKDKADLFASRLSKSTSSEVYGVGLDPDEFLSNQLDENITMTIFRSDGGTENLTLKNCDFQSDPVSTNGSVAIIDHTPADERTQQNQDAINSISYPVFLVTLDAVSEPAVTGFSFDSKKNNKNAVVDSSYWIQIEYIKVLRKHDSGDEEFMLHNGFHYHTWSDSMINPEAYVYYNQANIDFNGTTQENPPNSGRYIYINNVNSSSDTFDPPVLAIKLDNSHPGDYAGTGYVESDHGGTLLYKSYNYTDPWGYQRHKGAQYYKWLPNGSNGSHNQVYAQYGSASNNDDIYYGELLGVNNESVAAIVQTTPQFWLPAYYNILGQLITDLKVRYSRGKYPY